MYNVLVKKEKRFTMCVYIYIYIYICMYVSKYVYTHKNISSKKHNYIVLLVHDS